MTSIRKQSAVRTQKRGEMRKIRNLTEELSRDEYRLGIPLLDAAVAGVILGFKPSDREMRTQAQRCWEILKPQLNQHLLSEDEVVLRWAEGACGFSRGPRANQEEPARDSLTDWKIGWSVI